LIAPFTSISPVGAGAPSDTVTVPFTAPAASLDFLSESRPATGGDTSMRVDNFAIALGSEPSTFAALSAG